jgi:hypothetical protein
MIEMVDKNDMSLKASKTCFGQPAANFRGHTLSKDGHPSALHNLPPIKKMVMPSDVSELRRVLELMVQHTDNIPTWAFDARPFIILRGRAYCGIGARSATQLLNAFVPHASPIRY